MSIKSSIKVIKRQIEQKQQAFKEECQTILNDLFKEVFETYPSLESFSLVGYTPFFNDGDTCTYSIWLGAVKFNNVEYGDYADNSTSKLKEAKDSSNDLSEILSAIPSEIFLDIYGDHCKTTIKRDLSVVSEEYEHD